MEQPLYNSKLSIVNFYKEQLRKFEKIGVNNLTEYDVKVTDKLINTTKRRLSELSVTYNSSLTPIGERRRKKRLYFSNKEKK